MVESGVNVCWKPLWLQNIQDAGKQINSWCANGTDLHLITSQYERNKKEQERGSKVKGNCREGMWAEIARDVVHFVKARGLFSLAENKSLFSELIYQRPRENVEERPLVWRRWGVTRRESPVERMVLIVVIKRRKRKLGRVGARRSLKMYSSRKTCRAGRFRAGNNVREGKYLARVVAS